MRDTTMMKWFEAKVSACAEVAFGEMIRCSTERQYLWFCRGDLICSPDRPPDMELACPEPIPSHRELSFVRYWIRERAYRLPCLPATEE